jgi:hypothetical protein
MAAGEQTPLVSGVQDGKKVAIKVNIELIRFYGLIAGAVLLFTGLFVTTFFVNYPVSENPSSWQDKLFHGAPSDFDQTQTFIYEMFHFSHTCTMLDFNPSKTVAALVIMLHTLPCNAFVVLHYYRVMIQTDPKFAGLQSATPIMSTIQFIAFMYFYMVFVNSPYGHFGDPKATVDFTLHYIPYMLWQMGMLLMGIQQCWYIALKEIVPFGITPHMLWRYVQFLMVLFVVYCSFVWSFVLNRPLWDTNGQPGKLCAQIVMYGWDLCAVVVPTIFAFVESKNSNESVITFYEVLHE